MPDLTHKADRGSAEPPTPTSLLLCEDVTWSAAHQCHTLHGVLTRIIAPALPATVGPFIAFIRWSNVYASQRVVLTFGRDGSDKLAFRANLDSPKVSDPLQTHTLTPVVPRFRVTEPGRYLLQASHGGVPFVQSPVMVELATPERLS